jgi:hypothetical protein
MSVSDRGLSLADEGSARSRVAPIDGLKVLESVGGMSGSAVYVLDGNDYKLATAKLAGFLCEASGGTHATLLAAHACFIRSDGTLDDGAMPW